jgi:hypothetical protein
LNGTQIVVTLPAGVTFDFASAGTASVHGDDVVISLGRTPPGQCVELTVRADVSPQLRRRSALRFVGLLRTSTALPVTAKSTVTRINDK